MWGLILLEFLNMSQGVTLDDGRARGNFFHNASHFLENGRGRRGTTLVLVGFSAGVSRHSARPPRGPQTKLFRLFSGGYQRCMHS